LPDIDLQRAHDLGIEGARAAAERIAAELARRFELRREWNGDVLLFERPGVTGSLAITARDVHLTVTLGMLLKAMRSSIEQAAAAQLDALLARAAPAKRVRPSKSPRKRAG
jgi:putative polyhydroxyalkanoate system protein